MRPVEQKPAVAGAVGTILVWILIFLFFYLGAVLFAPKPFKTIKIRLDAPTKSEKQVKKVEQNSAKTQKSEAKETPKGDASSTALSETRSNPVSQDLPPSGSLPTPATPPKPRKKTFKEQKEFENLEAEIMELEERKSVLESEMASSDFTVAQKAGEEYKSVDEKLTADYARWEELAELG